MSLLKKKLNVVVNPVEAARNITQNAISVFTNLVNELDGANEILTNHKNSKIIEKHELQSKINDIDSEVDSVESAFKYNTDLKNRFNALLQNN